MYIFHLVLVFAQTKWSFSFIHSLLEGKAEACFKYDTFHWIVKKKINKILELLYLHNLLENIFLYFLNCVSAFQIHGTHPF